jgi:murein DD-endopeptidase MepM/ murein hydrolase activator NlpD
MGRGGVPGGWRERDMVTSSMRKTSLRRRAAAWFTGFVRTRQVYVRSRSDVHYITFTPVTQLALLCACLGGLFWLAYASVNVVFKDQLLALKQQNLFEARLDYEDQLAKLRSEIEKANDRLLINQQAYLKKVDEVKAEFDDLASQQDAIEGFFRRGWFPVRDGEGMPAKRKDASSLPWFAKQFAADFKNDANVLQPVADMRRLLAAQHARQLALIAHGNRYADGKLDRATALMTRLGLAPKASPPSDAVGGPFERMNGASELSQFGTQTQDALDKLQATLDDDHRVRTELKDLPLGLPMPNIERISSEFGVRQDPLRHEEAMHGGIDFISRYGAPVLATSDGTVVWSGPHGPYGNLVEILHDNGVSTRYGHLKGTHATVGQKVKRGDIIGWLGNTGRSTGPHLHYETRVSNRATDPRNFWRIQNDLQTLEADD